MLLRAQAALRYSAKIDEDSSSSDLLLYFKTTKRSKIVELKIELFIRNQSKMSVLTTISRNKFKSLLNVNILDLQQQTRLTNATKEILNLLRVEISSLVLSQRFASANKTCRLINVT